MTHFDPVKALFFCFIIYEDIKIFLSFDISLFLRFIDRVHLVK